ncbi:MAG: glycosyltransferase family 4 protein [Bdellovibrionia bacterium]
MHIAHVFPSLSWGGAEIYSLELATRQMQDGLSVSIWGIPGSKLLEEAVKRGLKTRTEKVSKRLDLMGLPRLARYIRNEKITHLHLHWSGGIWAFFGLKALAKGRIVYQNHLWISHFKIDPFHWAANSQIDRLIVAGPRAEENALKMWKFPSNKIDVIPYGIDLTRANGLDTKTEPTNLTFGLFARLDRQKGTREFLHALFSIVEDRNIHAVVVGDPTLNEPDAVAYSHEVEELIQGSRFRERIVRHTSTPDYLRLLAKCDVLVVPSYHESYSLLILDAFMLGKPVLATDSGGTPDLVSPERGWLVPPRDAHALAEAMKEISAAGSLEIERRGRNARAYVEANHAFATILSAFKKIY